MIRAMLRRSAIAGAFALAGMVAPASSDVRPLPAAPVSTATSTAGEATTGSSTDSLAIRKKMQRLTGVWIEGPGFDVTYGGSFDGCVQRCLVHKTCAMIEFYRPEKKCNLYDSVRPRRPGGSSDVAIRR